MIIQRVTSSSFRFRRQLKAAILTFVAFDVKAAVKRYHPHSFFDTRFRHDWQLANGTFWRETFVKIFDAVDGVWCIDGEGYAIQRFTTNDTCETLEKQHRVLHSIKCIFCVVLEWKKYYKNFQEHDFLRNLNFALISSVLHSREKSARNSNHVRNRVLETYSNTFFPLNTKKLVLWKFFRIEK